MLVASLELPDRSQPVRLRNLSEGGALVESAGIVERDCDILFRRNDLEVLAQVVWINGPFVGIAFKERIDRKVVLRHMPPSAARPTLPPLFKRPGLRSHQISSEEKKWIDHWVGSPGPRKLGT